jgi:hypothetical protein
VEDSEDGLVVVLENYGRETAHLQAGVSYVQFLAISCYTGLMLGVAGEGRVCGDLWVAPAAAAAAATAPSAAPSAAAAATRGVASGGGVEGEEEEPAQMMLIRELEGLSEGRVTR